MFKARMLVYLRICSNVDINNKDISVCACNATLFVRNSRKIVFSY
jgi:hypothetical protein